MKRKIKKMILSLKFKNHKLQLLQLLEEELQEKQQPKLWEQPQPLQEEEKQESKPLPKHKPLPLPQQHQVEMQPPPLQLLHQKQNRLSKLKHQHQQPNLWLQKHKPKHKPKLNHNNNLEQLLKLKFQEKNLLKMRLVKDLLYNREIFKKKINIPNYQLKQLQLLFYRLTLHNITMLRLIGL